ncbi:SIR2 family protein, partial [Pseudoflavonifractor sp. An187]|uniref:SIR2 family protein n=1 Tax=Pseudoflavonifractor sp. An187 TaxID=1965578 RepID=UPI000B57339F
MAAITFTQIMNCYPDNPLVYKHIKQDCSKLIPFVGAGLSVLCYPLWPKALKELAEQVAVPETKTQIVDMIEGKNPQLLEAAQDLEDYWGQRGMADHLLELFSAAKIQEHREKLHHQSVWLLPLLFPGKPAVTTNFDRVLETVYHMQGCQFDTKILPNRQELQDQLRQGERHGLLKLHGDIGSETLEYSSIIFGKRQYEEAYQPGTPMVTNLQAWFSGKMLLFLGCSLKADEYLNLLQEVVQLHPGVTHYAILECEDVRDAAARAKKLRDQWGIQALFYPKGRHEAVRVILEKLLEDHNPTAYQSLPTHVGALSNQSPSSRFHYKSGAVSFHGRREELEQLRAFCGQENVAFRWWAVTGAGGAGKSRLVYEFGQEMKGSGWNVLWVNSSHMDQLESLSILTKTLAVVDYAQAYLRPLGHWMEQLAQRPRLVPVRLLLLERDGETLDSSSWGSGLRAEVGRATLVRRSCWREPFLQLFPLQEEELLRIMTDFAATVGKSLPEAKAQQLLETLKTTDPGLRRPLYAMFLTDAWANGEEPEQWGQEAVLDDVLKRENEYFEEKLGPKLYDLSEVFCHLRLVATIWDGITPEQVAQEYPRLWSEFQDQSNTSNCAKMENKLLRQVGLLQGTELVGLKPDLLGEYFVLQHLNEPEVLQLLFPDGWQAKVEVVTFLFRMYLDYHDALENMEIFWNYMLCSPVDTVMGYGMMWVNVAGLSKRYVIYAVDILKALWEAGGQQEMDAKWYAMGLYNLSNEQKLEGAKVTVERIKDLQERYSGNEEIALEYAKGLFNLSCDQDVAEAEASVERLREVQERYYGNEEIALRYARGLFNLTNKQELEGREVTVERLRELQERYFGNEEIALVYAQGLFNLSCDQDVAEAEASVERLRELQERYSGNEEIAVAYAQGLFNLSCDQKVEEAEATVGRLKGLHEWYSGSEEIALEYSRGLFNLSNKQELEERKASVERLRALQERYCGNEEIVLWYAKGLFNLSCDQKVEEAQVTVE